MNAPLTRQTTPLSSLTLWEGNVRKHNTKGDLSALADSIQSVGLLQPLVIFNEDDKLYVAAGQRRLLALQMLQREDRIPADFPVSVTILDKEAALEASLAENVIREDMHPADKFQAFDALLKSGLNATEIGNKFGISVKEVDKLLALGRVAPTILDAFRADELDLDQVMAFTLTQDQEEQLQVWGRFKDLHSWQKNASQIKAALTHDEIRATDARVKIIGGVEAYEAAGGSVRRDLFDERNAGYLTDPELLEKLVAQAVDATRQALLKEGWSNVELLEDFTWQDRDKMVEEQGKRPALTDEQKQELTRLQAQRDEMDELYEANDEEFTDEQRDQYEQLETAITAIEDRPKKYSLATLNRSNAYIVVGHSGIEIYRGFTSKKAMPKKKGAAAEEEAATPAKSPYSAALTGELSTEVTGAIQAELAKNPKLALVALSFDIIRDVGRVTGVHFSKAWPRSDSPASRSLESTEEQTRGNLPQDEQQLWDWLKQQDFETLAKIIAPEIARTMDAKRHGTDRIRQELNVPLRTYFTPAAANYFGKIGKPQIVADLLDMGAIFPVDVKNFEQMKKAELAGRAETAAAEKPEWIPAPMRLDI